MDSEHPLIHLNEIKKSFTNGNTEITILKGITLDIHQGEMVAIIGTSGAGKSTLMNILGCMDVPTTGDYRVAGKSTKLLTPDELATLRRKRFGFIFQRYNLIPFYTALENIEVPSLYEKAPVTHRRLRAQALLDKFGLQGKGTSRPSQMSGGQQQRVSICRALINNPDIILADEPTGALDKNSGIYVLDTLKKLNQEGKTIIIITHDMQVAEAAQRIIRLEEGRVVDDSSKIPYTPAPKAEKTTGSGGKSFAGLTLRSLLFSVYRVIQAKPLRTFLTMLGIIIGIASVVLIQAIGEGAKDASLRDIRALAAKAIYVYPGTGHKEQPFGGVRILNNTDLSTILKSPYVDSATPITTRSVKIRTAGQEGKGMLYGVGSDFIRVRGLSITEGRDISEQDIHQHHPFVVIDRKARNFFFGKDESVVGRHVVINGQPATIIGVAERISGLFPTEEKDLNFWTNYNAAKTRWFGGDSSFSQINIRVKEHVDISLAEQNITELLIQLHGKKDFTLFNADAVAKTAESVGEILTFMLITTAVIALLVGGIGVMNIMLVSVVERTQEIGVRMAVGARRIDIMNQFLLESVILCILGGAIGVVFARALCSLFGVILPKIEPIFSWEVMVIAFIFSSFTGIVFGFFPARQAAQLQPAEALSRD